MGRPPLPVGTHGKVRTYELPSGGFRAKTKVRDGDGVTREVERTGRSRAAAERALKKALQERTSPTGGAVTGDSKIADVVTPSPSRTFVLARKPPEGSS